MRPLLRYAALYAALELAVTLLVIWAVGLGWTLVVLAASFLLGVVLAAAQWKGQIGALRRGRVSPHGAVADGVLVGVGSFLVFLPGLVSTAAGALMLAPPTRAAMRPLAATLVSRGVMRGVSAMDAGRFTGRVGRGDYIDGEYEVVGDPVQPGAPRRAGRPAIGA